MYRVHVSPAAQCDALHHDRYQSTTLGIFQTLDLIETFVNYHENIKKCICIVYDPQRSSRGSLALKAIRLKEQFIGLFKEQKLTAKDLRDANIGWRDVFQEIPIKVLHGGWRRTQVIRHRWAGRWGGGIPAIFAAGGQLGGGCTGWNCCWLAPCDGCVLSPSWVTCSKAQGRATAFGRTHRVSTRSPACMLLPCADPQLIAHPGSGVRVGAHQLRHPG